MKARKSAEKNSEISLIVQGGALAEMKEDKVDSDASPAKYSKGQHKLAQSSALVTKSKPLAPIPVTPVVESAQAITMTEQWIKAQLGMAGVLESRVTESTWWGDNFSDNIRNLGRVIGKTYSIADPNEPSKQLVLARYRIDWDKEKGRHFNIDVTIPALKRSAKPIHGKYVLQYGQLSTDLVAPTDEKKGDHSSALPLGELTVINASKEMTLHALASGTPMPYELAVKFVRYAGMTDPSKPGVYSPDVFRYFQGLGMVSGRLVSAANEIVAQEVKRQAALESEREAQRVEAVRAAEEQERVRKAAAEAARAKEIKDQEARSKAEKERSAALAEQARIASLEAATSSVEREVQVPPPPQRTQKKSYECPSLGGTLWACGVAVVGLFSICRSRPAKTSVITEVAPVIRASLPASARSHRRKHY